MTEIKNEDSIKLYEDFLCTVCGMKEKVHYKGCTPPFSRGVILKYQSYVMKDPFSPPGKGEILVLGADCDICGKSVCIGKECSLFYLKHYCLQCVNKNLNIFPLEIQAKVKRK